MAELDDVLVEGIEIHLVAPLAILDGLAEVVGVGQSDGYIGGAVLVHAVELCLVGQLTLVADDAVLACLALEAQLGAVGVEANSLPRYNWILLWFSLKSLAFTE